MTTHTNCSHPKTKAARSACRAGKAQPDGTPARSAAERLADKAAASSAKVGKPKAHSGDFPEPNAEEVGKGPYAKIYTSGHCNIGNHHICTGQYTLTPCTCTCHAAA
jgi:hypothetical protein